MKLIHADLHIHTCLSPCADLEMSPRAIVDATVSKGIGMIAVCDHNSAENAAAVMEAARPTGLTVLPGMEITSREEVHIVAIFGAPDEAGQMQSLVYEHLAGRNDPDTFGLQVIVTADGTVTGFNDRLLIGATSLALESIVQAIHAQNGLAIAAHIDREGFGILGQLGFIPAGLELDALELSAKSSLKDAATTFGTCRRYPFVQSSDAHVLSAIGAGTTPLNLETATFAELRMALSGEHGRHICYEA